MGKRKDSVEGVSLRDILNEAGSFLALPELIFFMGHIIWSIDYSIWSI